MTVPQVRTSERPQPFGWQTIRRYLTNRRVLLTLGGGVLIAGMALNWSWLAAAGIAPIILSLAPCAIMCGLGLCGMKMMGGSCDKQSTLAADAKQAAQPTVPSPALGANTMSSDRVDASSFSQTHETQTQSTQQQTTPERSESHA